MPLPSQHYQLKRNEFLPELMFQDWENIPDTLISESNIHEDAFKYFEVVCGMDVR